MRPIKLKMAAFEPYADKVELDFERGLSGENFFLIHGATGAGKTSILDAICYALYDKSSGGNRSDQMMRSKQAAPDVATEVEFEFALGDKIYSVRRRPEMAGEKKSAELYCNGKFIEGGAKNVTRRIEGIIGFKVDQFRQVIILPQGDFQKFLVSNSSQRGEVLNTIFDANFYGLIEERLKDNAAAAKQDCDKLKLKNETYLTGAREIGDVKNAEDIPALIEKIASDLQSAKNLRESLKNLADKAVADWNAGEILIKQFDAFDAAAENLRSNQIALGKIDSALDLARAEYEKRQAEENKRRDLENKIRELKKIESGISELRRKEIELENAEKNLSAKERTLKKLETKRQNYKSRLAELRQEAETLQDAEANFRTAEQKLRDSRERAAYEAEIERLKGELAEHQEKFALAEKNYNAAQIELERLETLLKLCTAAKLAENLAEGEPCPVCGAAHHPKLAVTDKIIPTDAEIAAAKAALKRHEEIKAQENNSVVNITARINAERAKVQRMDNAVALNQAQEIFSLAEAAAGKLKACRDNLKRGEFETGALDNQFEAARTEFETDTRAAEKLRGVVAEKKLQMPEIYLKNPLKIAEDLRIAAHEGENLAAAFKAAEENFHYLERQKSKCAGAVESAHAAKLKAEAALAGKSKPDITALKINKALAQDKYAAARDAVTLLENNLQRLQEIFNRLNELAKKTLVASKNYQIWQRLADAANGKNSRVTFQRYYLNAIFQDIVFEANERLDRMSGGRYRFRSEKNALSRRKLEGLELEIWDANIGTARAVETLSGGESFLASLSLALGLAAVVKNTAGGIKLDTIFIDEGFGSLDSETLDVAMNALIDLQSGGRLVGIISHVDELKSRIPVRLEVTKNKFGSTARFAE